MAVLGTGAGECVKDRKTSKQNLMGLSPRFLHHLRRLKPQPPAEAPIKGKLRMKSTSGAFVILGVFVVLLGMTIAVIGYWPQRSPIVTSSGLPLNSSRTLEAKSSATVQSRSSQSTDKLKLIGPVIMGVGLFIFICANTMLYENRDLETRLLVQKNLYSMAVGLACDSSVDLKYCQKKADSPEHQTKPEEGFQDIDLHSCIPQNCSSPISKWAECCGSYGLHTTALLLHHNGVSPSISLRSIYSDSSNSVQGNAYLPSMHTTIERRVSSMGNVVPLPLIKVNNCIVESPDVAQLANKGEPNDSRSKEQRLSQSWNILPRISHSSMGEDLDGSHVVINVDNVAPTNYQRTEFLSPECARREFSSDMQLNNVGHSKSLDLGRRGVKLVATTRERRNRSWPRLDSITLIGYNKLENRGDSVETSLEQSDPSMITGPSSQDSIGDVV
ncbi:transmembrane protein 200B [Ambystoma mexicanum]|uniref:transmembrane protein 200B n=1 Tax=Ambystoma mexicanum TaxID=8296 RepID=UPI0037E770EA